MAQAQDMSTAEWELMRVIWTMHEAGSSDIIRAIQGKKDWTESTIKTLLRRLVNKEVLTTRKVGQKFIYQPLIGEDEAMDQMTAETFDRLCRMKRGRAISKRSEERRVGKECRYRGEGEEWEVDENVKE